MSNLKTEILTVTASTTSTAIEVTNGNKLLPNEGASIYPVGIMCADVASLTTDTVFRIQHEESDGSWSTVKSTNGTDYTLIHTQKATIPLDSDITRFLKNRNIRVIFDTEQAGPLTLKVFYDAL